MTYNCYDLESGRIVSVFANVAAARIVGASLTQGVAWVTVPSTAELWPGMVVVGKGIPANTVILCIDSETVFTMTAQATADVTESVIVARGYISETVVRELHIEHYRDIFSASSGFGVGVGGSGPGGLPASPTVANGASVGSTLYITCPVASAVPSGGGIAGFITGELHSSQSDEVSHTAPREQKQKVSHVFFVCTDGAILPAPIFPNLHFAQDATEA